MYNYDAVSYWLAPDGVKYTFKLQLADSFDDHPVDQPVRVRAVTLCDGKLVVIGDSNRVYGHPGGGVESGETWEQGLARELVEETNTKLLWCCPLGYQHVFQDDIHLGTDLRYLAVVEKIGDFIGDPGGNVVSVDFVNPDDYRQYIQWGDAGDLLVRVALQKYREYLSGPEGA